MSQFLKIALTGLYFIFLSLAWFSWEINENFFHFAFVILAVFCLFVKPLSQSKFRQLFCVFSNEFCSSLNRKKKTCGKKFSCFSLIFVREIWNSNREVVKYRKVQDGKSGFDYKWRKGLKTIKIPLKWGKSVKNQDFFEDEASPHYKNLKFWNTRP